MSGGPTSSKYVQCLRLHFGELFLLSMSSKSSEFGRMRAICQRCRPNSQILSKFGPNWLDSSGCGRIRPRCCPTSPISGQDLANTGRTRLLSAESNQVCRNWRNSGLISNKCSRADPKFDRIRPRFGRSSPNSDEFDQIRPNSGQLRWKVCQVWPNSSQVWWKSVKVGRSRPDPQRTPWRSRARARFGPNQNLGVWCGPREFDI